MAPMHFMSILTAVLIIVTNTSMPYSSLHSCTQSPCAVGPCPLWCLTPPSQWPAAATASWATRRALTRPSAARVQGKEKGEWQHAATPVESKVGRYARLCRS